MTAALLGDAAAVSLVLGAGLAAATVLGRQSAAARHWLLAACVGGALALPVLRVAIPAPWAARFDRARSAPAASPIATATLGDAALATSPVSRPRPFSMDAAAAPSAPRPAWSRLALAFWAAGTIVLLGRLSAALLHLRRLARHGATIDDHVWRAAADGISRALGIRGRVRLVATPHPSLVATWGWRRPVVAVPHEALSWPATRVEVVLAHELAHVARGDWRHQLAAELLAALHWVNPIAWAVRRRLLVESERASDDVVLALGVAPATYADHLVDLARRLRSRPMPWLPAPAMARRSSLEGRVLAMLDATTARQPVSRRLRLAVGAALVAAILPLAALAAAAQLHTVRGRLSDPSGRSLPDATVMLTATGSDRRYEVRADAAGRFEFVGLPPGSYRLEVRTPGFRIHREAIDVSGDVERAVRLAVGTLQETVTIVGDGRPDPPPDAATVERQEAARRRAGERQQRALAVCRAGPPAAAGGNILPPAKIVHVSPAYPDHLRPAAVHGTVTLRAIIDREGVVRAITDVVATHPDFAAPAVDAVRAWRFTTTLLNCEPIEVEMTVALNFSTAP